MARNLARQFMEAGERNKALQAEQERAAQFKPRDDFYCLGRWINHDLASVETIERVLNTEQLRAKGPTPEDAIRELTWRFASMLFRRKIESDFEVAKKRAIDANFYLAEVLNKRPE